MGRAMLKVSQLPETNDQVRAITMARTAFGRPLFTVQAYVVDGWLIDCGPPATAGEMVRFARERNLRGVVNTHQHEDHAGGDVALHRSLGWVPRAPVLTVPFLANPPHLELYRRVVWGQPAPVRAEPLSERFEADRHSFHIIPTPGHCPDHAGLLEPNEGWLFSGDLYVGERVKYLRFDEDACLTLDSLRRVLGFDFAVMFCSHAGMLKDGQAALRRKIDFWENVQGRARELHQAGHSLESIRDQVLGPEGRMTPITRGHFSKLNLIQSLLRE
jgi:glyoxylase-like metal-dependent hydrolase (beta-lactamase superfamily II)